MKFRTDEMTTPQMRDLWECMDNRKKKPVPTDEELPAAIKKMMSNNLNRSATAWGYVNRMLSLELLGFLDKTPLFDWITIRRTEKILLWELNTRMIEEGDRMSRKSIYVLLYGIFPLYRKTTYAHMVFNLKKHGFIAKMAIKTGDPNIYTMTSLGRLYLKTKQKEIAKLVLDHNPEDRPDNKRTPKVFPWVRDKSKKKTL